MTTASTPQCHYRQTKRAKCGPPQCNESLKYVRIDEPYYNGCTFLGRFRHYLAVTFPTRALHSEWSVERSNDVIRAHHHNRLRECISVDDLWYHKYMTHSHVHPQTGEPFHRLTRWPSQILMNTLIAAGMLTFYKTYVGLAFWQWANQSYQSYVTWNHRRVNSCISDKQLLQSYALGTVGSIGTAVALKAVTNRYFAKAPTFVPKLIPLAAVLVGNMLSVPVLRAQELRYGVPVYDQLDKRMGTSVLAAQYDVTQHIIVRNTLFALPLLMAPFLIRHFRKDNVYWICRFPLLRPVLQVAMLGSLFALSTPLALAMFREKGAMPYCDLESNLRYKLQQRFGNNVPYVVFYQSEC